MLRRLFMAEERVGRSAFLRLRSDVGSSYTSTAHQIQDLRQVQAVQQSHGGEAEFWRSSWGSNKPRQAQSMQAAGLSFSREQGGQGHSMSGGSQSLNRNP